MPIDARIAGKVAEHFQDELPGKRRGGVVAGKQTLAQFGVHAAGEELRRHFTKAVALLGGEHGVDTDAHGARLVDTGQKAERLRAHIRALPLVPGERFQRGGAGRPQAVKAVEQKVGGSTPSRT